MWIILALVSAILLGIYDVFKKYSVDGNAVMPVLLISTCTSSVIFIPFTVGSIITPDLFKSIDLFVPSLDIYGHLFVFIKAIIVVSSWVMAFHAVKHLPITIVSPIRATGPVWTLIGAILIFNEQLNLMQWVGVLITLLFFYLLSTAGKLEGIRFSSDKWVLLMIGGTLLGAISGLYDKFIIRKIDRMAVQAWFSFYQVAILLPTVYLMRWSKPKKRWPKFHWRWTIPAIGLFLVLADFAYFYALSYEDSMISIVSALRRGGVLVPFLVGAFLLNEINIKRKAIYLAGILLGMFIITFAS